MPRVFISIVRRHAPSFFSPRMSEWFTCIMLLGTGLMLAGNADLMANPNTHAYDALLKLGTQAAWSQLLMIFAAVRMVVLAINGAWRASPVARCAMAFLACFFWAQMVLSLYEAFGFAFVFGAGWMAVEVMNVMRAARDVRDVTMVAPLSGRSLPRDDAH